MLSSHLEYPICDCVHSKSILPSQTPFWNMSLVARTKQWTAPELNKNAVHTRTRCPLCCLSTRSRPCTRAPAPCPNFSVGTWKKGVFILVPSGYCTRAPCPGTKCECCLTCTIPCIRLLVFTLGSLRYGDYGLRLRLNMLLRMIKTTWLFIFPA